MTIRFLTLVLSLSCLLGCSTLPSKRSTQEAEAVAIEARDQPLRFVVSFPETVHDKPITARVLLMLSKSEHGEPRYNTGWFNLEPIYAIDAESMYPGDLLVFSPKKFNKPDALAFPEPLGQLEPGTYYAQALIDLDQSRRNFVDGPGNLYSQPVRCEINREQGGTIELIADQVVEDKEPEDTDWVKFIKIRSSHLSEFHGRDIFLRAAVLLPKDFDENSEKYYPAIYTVPGFGGRHTGLLRFDRSDWGKEWMEGKWPLECLRVRLDPDVPLGHSVFANSANNGPVGDALVKELIPAIEKRFRAIPESTARFVRGHSSGGWSSLWLQVAYPDFFGGCWSTAPDPVDFSAFQTVNIYQDKNAHWTTEGYPRPVARSRDEVTLNILTMNHWEYVTGYGGQLDSFDAVFSPRGPDGFPMPLINKLTGEIDAKVAEQWRQYDIRNVLEEKWLEIGAALQGKLHVIGGAWDSFYLEPALFGLREFLETTNYGGYVEIHPGDHGSFYHEELDDRIWNEIAAVYKAHSKSKDSSAP